MTDIMTSEQRSERMSRVRNKDSKPERRVRSLLHRLGFRFRLHVASLPGNPDIVLRRHAKVILIHGFYWHRHRVCRQLSNPGKPPGFLAQEVRGKRWPCRRTRRRGPSIRLRRGRRPSCRAGGRCPRTAWLMSQSYSWGWRAFDRRRGDDSSSVHQDDLPCRAKTISDFQSCFWLRNRKRKPRG